jgi:hypothetical protein
MVLNGLDREGEPLEYQTPETAARAVRKKLPAQVNIAGSAKGDAPLVAMEPGEFICQRTAGTAAFGVAKTTDVVNAAGGIGEGVLVTASDNGLLLGPGDQMSTAATENDGFRIGRCQGVVVRRSATERIISPSRCIVPAIVRRGLTQTHRYEALKGSGVR